MQSTTIRIDWLADYKASVYLIYEAGEVRLVLAENTDDGDILVVDEACATQVENFRLIRAEFTVGDLSEYGGRIFDYVIP
jgi:hypothetical protein